jgi:hypothetical protein
MKKQLLVCLGLIGVISLGAGACATTPVDKTVERSNLVSVTATVEAIDQATRVVTLRGPKGDKVTFEVDKDVRNLGQVNVGDQVIASYYESLVMRVLEPGEAAINEGSAGVSRAVPGATPAGAGARQLTVTVSIEAIDKAKGTVTFKGPTGNVRTVKAADPKNLEKIKVGDRVAISYTEALAISVEKIKK